MAHLGDRISNGHDLRGGRTLGAGCPSSPTWSSPCPTRQVERRDDPRLPRVRGGLGRTSVTWGVAPFPRGGTRAGVSCASNLSMSISGTTAAATSPVRRALSHWAAARTGGSLGPARSLWRPSSPTSSSPCPTRLAERRDVGHFEPAVLAVFAVSVRRSRPDLSARAQLGSATRGVGVALRIGQGGHRFPAAAHVAGVCAAQSICTSRPAGALSSGRASGSASSGRQLRVGIGVDATTSKPHRDGAGRVRRPT
jgi:hypothetical protein